MATIATLAVNLTANTSAFSKGMKKAGGSLGGFLGKGAKIAGGAIAGAAAGMAVLVKRAIDVGDKVQKLAIATGNSTEFFSEIKRAAELSGTSLDTVGKSMIKLQRATVDATQGTKTQIEAFEALGINVEAFAALSPDEQFNAIADAVSKVEDPMIRMAAGSDLMGRGFAELLPLLEGGSAAMDEMREASRAAGESLTREQADKLAAVNDAMLNLESGFAGFANTLAIEFAPAIVSTLDLLTARLPAIIELFKGLFNIVGKLLGAGLASVVELLSGNFSGVAAIGEQLGVDLRAAGGQVARGAAGTFAAPELDEVVSETQTTNQILGRMDKKLTGAVGTQFE